MCNEDLTAKDNVDVELAEHLIGKDDPDVVSYKMSHSHI